MSTSASHLSPAAVREGAACMCAFGDACSSFAPGHALHLIQARLASATPRGWVDAVVESADAGTGTLRLRTLDGVTHDVWNAGGAALEAAPGVPVALHGEYGVLAIGRARYNVAA